LLIKTWCIPPKADAEFVYRMEDILQVYQQPYDPQVTVICLDEASKQLISEVAIPLLTKPSQVKRVDHGYARQGVCNLFVLCEPSRSWRHVNPTQRRTKRDWVL